MDALAVLIGSLLLFFVVAYAITDDY